MAKNVIEIYHVASLTIVSNLTTFRKNDPLRLF